MFKLRKNESGAVIVLFVITLPVLLAVMGLVVDLGYAYMVKRWTQNAADAAALAGAHTVKREDPSNVTNYALEEAASNGFDGSQGETIIVNRPPQSGDFTGDSDFVEVKISQQLNTLLMGVLYNDHITVSARAVAGVLPGSACIYVLDGTADKAIEVSSGSSLISEGCGLNVSSCSDQALSVTSGSSLTADSIAVCGDYDSGGSTIEPEPNTGECYGAPCNRGEDPLEHLNVDLPHEGCDHIDFKVSSKGTTDDRHEIDPGVYCNGISIESGSHVQFNSGTYYLKGGGLQIQSGSSAEGDGVGFYNTSGSGYDYEPINFSSNTEVRFSAQTGDAAGDMDGVLFFQDRNVGSGYDNNFESSTNSWFEGTLYFPTQHLIFQSNTVGYSAADWTLVIANTLQVSSGSSVQIASDFQGAQSPIEEVTLAE